MGSQSQEGSGSGHRAILDSCPSGLQPSCALVQKRVIGSWPFSELSGTGGKGGTLPGSPRPFQSRQAKVKPEPRLGAGLTRSSAPVPATGGRKRNKAFLEPLEQVRQAAMPGQGEQPSGSATQR